MLGCKSSILWEYYTAEDIAIALIELCGKGITIHVANDCTTWLLCTLTVALRHAWNEMQLATACFITHKKMTCKVLNLQTHVKLYGSCHYQAYHFQSSFHLQFAHE